MIPVRQSPRPAFLSSPILGKPVLGKREAVFRRLSNGVIPLGRRPFEVEYLMNQAFLSGYALIPLESLLISISITRYMDSLSNNSLTG